jgi:hypothetical protein
MDENIYFPDVCLRTMGKMISADKLPSNFNILKPIIIVDYNFMLI